MNRFTVLICTVCFLAQISAAAPSSVNNTVPNNGETIFLNNIQEEKNIIQTSNQELSNELIEQNQKMMELQEETQKNLKREIRDEMPVPRMINLF